MNELFHNNTIGNNDAAVTEHLCCARNSAGCSAQMASLHLTAKTQAVHGPWVVYQCEEALPKEKLTSFTFPSNDTEAQGS